MMNSVLPQKIVETAVCWGLTVVDWISTNKTDPKLLKKICEDAGLKMAAHIILKNKISHHEKNYMAEFKQSLEDAFKTGVPILMRRPPGHAPTAPLKEDIKGWPEYYATYPLSRPADITQTVEKSTSILKPKQYLDTLWKVYARCVKSFCGGEPAGRKMAESEPRKSAPMTWQSNASTMWIFLQIEKACRFEPGLKQGDLRE